MKSFKSLHSLKAPLSTESNSNNIVENIAEPLPCNDNSSPYGINRLPHLARTAPYPYNGLHLSDTGIGVPSDSTPTHIEFRTDRVLNQRIYRKS